MELSPQTLLSAPRSTSLLQNQEALGSLLNPLNSESINSSAIIPVLPPAAVVSAHPHFDSVEEALHYEEQREHALTDEIRAKRQEMQLLVDQLETCKRHQKSLSNHAEKSVPESTVIPPIF
jgi:hypothetical protein